MRKVLFSTLLLCLVSFTSAAAQTTAIIDQPADGSTLAQPFTISGWAVDASASSDTGIDWIHVWAYPNPGSGQPGVFWGAANIGEPRPDVGNLFGRSEFNNCGFSLKVVGQTPAPYQVVVYIHSYVRDVLDSRVLNLTPQANPAMVVDHPLNNAEVLQPFALDGWAIDQAAASGSGIDAVHVWAYPNPGSGQAGIFVGAASVGVYRSDLIPVLGQQFAYAGYSTSISGLPAGPYQLVVFARSTVTGNFDQAISFNVTIDSTVATPTMSPPPGTYSSPQSVTISTSTSGAVIRYTTDGSEPTSNSTLASGPVSINANQTLKAKGFRTNWLPSATATAAYALKVQTPSLTPGAGQYASGLTVTISESDPSATLNYTTNGTDPTQASTPITSGQSINVATTTTVKVRAFRTGFSPSDIASAKYTIANPVMVVEAPQEGAYLLQPFTTSGWAIDRAATNGTGVDTVHVWAYPQPSGDPIFVGAATYGIKRSDIGAQYGNKFTNSGYSRSISGLPAGAYQLVVFARSTVTGTFNNTLTRNITVDPTVATPTFSLASGTYIGMQSVSISSPTSGAVVHYTTNGADPTESSPVVNGAILLDRTMTIKARGYKAGYFQSTIGSRSYVLKVPTPTITPGGGTYTDSVEITFDVADPAAALAYWLDNGAPRAIARGGTITLENESPTVHVQATRAGFTSSDIRSEDFTVQPGHPPDQLLSSQHLNPDDFLVSPNGQNRLIYQLDGNLVLYDSVGSAVWNSGTGGSSPGTVTMRADGNIIITDASANEIWSSQTSGNEGSFLEVRDSGSAIVIGPDAEAVWAQGPCPKCLMNYVTPQGHGTVNGRTILTVWLDWANAEVTTQLFGAHGAIPDWNGQSIHYQFVKWDPFTAPPGSYPDLRIYENTSGNYRCGEKPDEPIRPHSACTQPSPTYFRETWLTPDFPTTGYPSDRKHQLDEELGHVLGLADANDTCATAGSPSLVGQYGDTCSRSSTNGSCIGAIDVAAVNKAFDTPGVCSDVAPQPATPPPGPDEYCGDGVCNGEEDASWCPEDCSGGGGSGGDPEACNNNSVCDNSETCSSCAADCGSCDDGGGGSTCGTPTLGDCQAMCLGAPGYGNCYDYCHEIYGPDNLNNDGSCWSFLAPAPTARAQPILKVQIACALLASLIGCRRRKRSEGEFE